MSPVDILSEIVIVRLRMLQRIIDCGDAASPAEQDEARLDVLQAQLELLREQDRNHRMQ